MLSFLGLENFKAFGEKQLVQCAPITLIFGENSAGKSSILQALSLLKQSHEERRPGAALVPAKEGGIVDLGTCYELMHDHDLNQKLSIALFMIDAGSPDYYEPEDDEDDSFAEMLALPNWDLEKLHGIGYTFQQTADPSEMTLAGFSTVSMMASKPVKTAVFEPKRASFSHDAATEPDNDDSAIEEEESSTAEMDRLARIVTATLACCEPGSPLVPFLPGDTEFDKLGQEYACRWVTDSQDVWLDKYEKAKANSHQICEFVRKSVAKLDTDIAEHVEMHVSGQPPCTIERILENEVSIFSSDFTYEQFVEHMRQTDLGALATLRGFEVLRTTESPVASLFRLLSYNAPEPGASFDRTDSPAFLRSTLGMEIGEVARRGLRDTASFLERLVPLGPLRQSPQRWYAYAGTRAVNVGYNGELMPNVLLRNPSALESTNEWLQRLGTGYRIEPRRLTGGSQDLYELRLVDATREPHVEVSLADVGYGISQILPFIVQSFAGSGQTITIEQPEVHIHPRLQADLGSLLAAAIRMPHGNQFIIETHSEHLVLRLQRLIREGTLRPKDVAINYVSRGKDGSRVERLDLDNKGEFVKPWPDDFFELSFYERFGDAR